VDIISNFIQDCRALHRVRLYGAKEISIVPTFIQISARIWL